MFFSYILEIFWHVPAAGMNIQGEWTLLIHVTSNKEHEIFPHIYQPYCPAVCMYNHHSKVAVKYVLTKMYKFDVIWLIVLLLLSFSASSTICWWGKVPINNFVKFVFSHFLAAGRINLPLPWLFWIYFNQNQIVVEIVCFMEANNEHVKQKLCCLQYSSCQGINQEKPSRISWFHKFSIIFVLRSCTTFMQFH